MTKRSVDGVAGRKRHERRNGLTLAKRDVFLETLAQTCCVGSAVAATGANRSSFYALRLRDGGFAAQWIEALRVGYDAVEGQLLRYVIERGVDEVDETASAARLYNMPGTGLPADRVPAWVQVGMLLLNKHRATIEGGRPRGQSPRIGTPAETDALLTRKLDQLARSIRRSGGAVPEVKNADTKNEAKENGASDNGAREDGVREDGARENGARENGGATAA